VARFYVFPSRKGERPPQPISGSYVLRPEPLIDAGFKTTFHLRRLDQSGRETAIGNVKILRRGQQTGQTSLDATFTELSAEYGSLGAELEYYRTLLDVAGHEARDVLHALGDLATERGRRQRFEQELGFKASLVRFTPARLALEEAATLFDATNAPEVLSAGRTLMFHTHAGGATFSISFDFNVVPELPSRMSVVVGPNGSGKTRLLANIALAAFDPTGTPSAGRSWGTFDGNLQFSRVLAFSYSAFDDFDLPAESRRQRETFIRRDTGLGYRYCGLRDLSTKQSPGRRPSSDLKTPQQLRNDFARAVEEALSEDRALLFRVLDLLFTEPSFAAAGVPPVDDGEEDSRFRTDLDRTFSASSAGHKIVLLMTAQLAAFVREGALILVDEPESHLHPPLLAMFLKILHIVLQERRSNAIVATHSPFVVQETPSRHIRIISRRLDRTTVALPEIETFGEDIGTISREVFRLDTRVGEYVDTLRALSDRFTLDRLEALFDNGMSGQARALVLAMQARKGSSR
jgi:predicted ATPase